MRLRPSETRMASAVRRLGGAPRDPNKDRVVNCFRCKYAGDTHCKVKPRMKLRETIVCEDYHR